MNCDTDLDLVLLQSDNELWYRFIFLNSPSSQPFLTWHEQEQLPSAFWEKKINISTCMYTSVILFFFLYAGACRKVVQELIISCGSAVADFAGRRNGQGAVNNHPYFCQLRADLYLGHLSKTLVSFLSRCRPSQNDGCRSVMGINH